MEADMDLEPRCPGEHHGKRVRVRCPDCNFLIRTEDEDEIVEHVRMHAAEKHDREVDEERVRNRIRPI